MLASFHCVPVAWPARKADFAACHTMRTPGPLIGRTSACGPPTTTKFPLGVAKNVLGSGAGSIGPVRGPPLVCVGPNVSAPLLPALSRHVPLSDARPMPASMFTGFPAGSITTLRPSVIVPFTCGTAMPCTGCRGLPPHCSSNPSSVKMSLVCCVTVNVSTLQNGSVRQRNVPSTCASAAVAIPHATTPTSIPTRTTRFSMSTLIDASPSWPQAPRAAPRSRPPSIASWLQALSASIGSRFDRSQSGDEWRQRHAVVFPPRPTICLR
jgi:hypothetical protein